MSKINIKKNHRHHAAPPYDYPKVLDGFRKKGGAFRGKPQSENNPGQRSKLARCRRSGVQPEPAWTPEKVLRESGAAPGRNAPLMSVLSTDKKGPDRRDRGLRKQKAKGVSRGELERSGQGEMRRRRMRLVSGPAPEGR